MTPAARHSAEWASWLVSRESRGSGDTDNAMRRLSNRYGIDYRTFWSLKYRPPRDVLTGVYLSIRAAYMAECERQERLLRLQYENAKAAGLDGALMDAVEAVVGEPLEKETGE